MLWEIHLTRNEIDRLRLAAEHAIIRWKRSDTLYRYENCCERKWKCEDGKIQQLFAPVFCSGSFVKRLWESTGITCLPDPTLRGAGVDIMEPGDFLALHRDAQIHPELKLQRALSVVINLSDHEGGEFWWDNRLYRPQIGSGLAFVPEIEHGVSKVEGDRPRVTASCFYYSTPLQKHVITEGRTAAEFVNAEPDFTRTRSKGIQYVNSEGTGS